MQVSYFPIGKTESVIVKDKSQTKRNLPNRQGEFEKARGIEVLTFDHVELTKHKSDKNSFLEVGTLRVLYFPDFDRFILDLGEWEYALLKRLPVTGSSRTDMASRTYTFPTYNGFYVLKFTKIIHQEALQNFETILNHSTRFNYFGEEVPKRQNELSPDVGLMERSEENPEIVPHRSSIAQSSKSSISETEEIGELHGREKVKRTFAKFFDKISGSHAKKIAENNLFLTRVMDYDSLKNSKVDFAPHVSFGSKEILLAIKKSKDIAKKMHLGASPNALQFINRETLAESLAKAKSTTIEKETEQSIMTESVELLPYKDTTVSKEEYNLLKEIEKEKERQLTERGRQEEHRLKELAYIEKERELHDRLMFLQDDIRVNMINKTEEKFKSVIDQKDDTILERARTRESDLAVWEQREKDLVAELRKRLDELQAKEKLSEEERLEFTRKEQQLLEVNQRLDAEKRNAEIRAKEMAQEAQIKHEELAKREQLTADEYRKLKEKEKQLEVDIQKRIDELKAKADLTEKERQELVEQQEAMVKIIGLKAMERSQIEKEQQLLYEDATRILAELNQREKMTEAERLALEEREKELQAQHEKALTELRAREFLTEEQQREIVEREKELKRVAALREAERVEFIRRQLELQAAAEKRETELRAREQLTENEKRELEEMKMKLQKQNVIKEIELRDILKRRDELFEEAEKRVEEISKRMTLTEAEYEALQTRELEMETELQRRLGELEFKHELTEYERKELETRKKELSKLRETRELEIKARQIQSEKLKEHEATLLEQNKELIKGHREMHDEIRELKSELEKPVEKIVRETITQKKETTFGDVTQI